MLRRPIENPERRKSDSANPIPTSTSSEKQKVFNTRRPSGGEWHSGDLNNGRDPHGETSAAGAAAACSVADGKGINKGFEAEITQFNRNRQKERDPQAEAIKLREWVAETLRNSVPPSHTRDSQADAEEDQHDSNQQHLGDAQSQKFKPPLSPPPASNGASASASTPTLPRADVLRSAPPSRSRALERRRGDPSYEDLSELGVDLRTRPTSMHAQSETAQNQDVASGAASVPSSPSKSLSVLQGGLKAFSASRYESQQGAPHPNLKSEGSVRRKRVQIEEEPPRASDGEYYHPAAQTRALQSDTDSLTTQEAVVTSSQEPTSFGRSFSRSHDALQGDHLAADRVGLGVGMGSLGAASDVNNLLMQGLDSRRSSFAEDLPSPALGYQSTHSRDPSTTSGSNPATPSLNHYSSSPSGKNKEERAERMGMSLGMAPRLSKSTLQALGNIEGLTPDPKDNPYLNPLDTQHLHDLSIPRSEQNQRGSSSTHPINEGGGTTPTSSVVSAGLEMGLGMNLATQALFSALPGTSMAGAINFLAEPRYSHQNSVSMAQNLSSHAQTSSSKPVVSVTTRELDRPLRSSLIQGISASRQSSPSNNSNQAPIGTQASSTIYSPVTGGARLPSLNLTNLSERGIEDEPPLSAVDRAESELARRRTTGSNNERGWQAGKNRAALAAKEAGKPRGSIKPLSPALESTSPISDFNRRGSAASSNARDHRPPSAQDHSDLKGLTGSAAGSNTTGSISASAWYSSKGSSSTQGGTPSLGERALLSPEIHPHLDDPFNRNDHAPHFAHGGSGGRQTTVMPTRSTATGGVRFGGDRKETPLHDAAGGNSGTPLIPSQGALMGVGSGSHFGPGVRAKVAEVLGYLIESIPIDLDLENSSEERDFESAIVNICEFGALNSRSMQLMQGIISQFSQRANSNPTDEAGSREKEALRKEAEPSSMDLGRKRSARSNLAQSYFGGGETSGARERVSSNQRSSTEDTPSKVSFCITHEDSPTADFRALTQLLDAHYLDPHFLNSHSPSLQNHVFPSFVARPFASRIAPSGSFHLGFSLMDLHWSHTPRNTAVSLATTAHSELFSFLTARSNEFRAGGILLVAYIARSEEKVASDGNSGSQSAGPASPVMNHLNQSGSAPTRDAAASRPAMHARSSSSPYDFSLNPQPPQSSASSPGVHARSGNKASSQSRTDIWTTLTNSLAPCLQRLVSCGMLKPALARQMLVLPMHPRTPNQTKAVLKGLKHVWKVEWSCGLGEGEEVTEPGQEQEEEEQDGSGFNPSRRASKASEGLSSSLSEGEEAHKSSSKKKELKSEPAPLRLTHPASKAFVNGTLSRVAFAEHLIQLYKNLFEGHFRAVLRDQGKLSKGAVEFVIDSLWDVLYSRIELDQSHIRDVEIEVGIVALRKI